MTLDEYLQANSPKALSEKTDITEASLSRLRNGKQKPSLDMMNALYVGTGGAVTPNDWLGIAA